MAELTDGELGDVESNEEPQTEAEDNVLDAIDVNVTTDDAHQDDKQDEAGGAGGAAAAAAADESAVLDTSTVLNDGGQNDDNTNEQEDGGASATAPASKAGRKKKLTQNERRALEGAKKTHFVTGVDIFSPEQQEAMRKRAAKYGLAVEEGGGGDAAATAAAAAAAVAEDAAGLVNMEDDKKIAEMAWRAAKFNLPIDAYEFPKDPDFREEPKQATEDSERRWEVIHLYGLDHASTEDVMRFFRGYDPSHVEWLDDSSCNVVFVDRYSAKRALHSMGRPVKDSIGALGIEAEKLASLQRAEAVSMLVEAQRQVRPEDENGWWGGRIWQRPGKEGVRLFARYATTADVRPDKPKKSLYRWLPPTKQIAMLKKTGQLPAQKTKKRRAQDSWQATEDEGEWGEEMYENEYYEQEEGGGGGAADAEGDESMRLDVGDLRDMLKRKRTEDGSRRAETEEAAEGGGEENGGTDHHATGEAADTHASAHQHTEDTESLQQRQQLLLEQQQQQQQRAQEMAAAREARAQSLQSRLGVPVQTEEEVAAGVKPEKGNVAAPQPTVDDGGRAVRGRGFMHYKRELMDTSE